MGLDSFEFYKPTLEEATDRLEFLAESLQKDKYPDMHAIIREKLQEDLSALLKKLNVEPIKKQ